MRYVLLGLLLFLTACTSPAAITLAKDGTLKTGLQGVVLRGPIQPVCRENEPCDDEPFAASFSVEQGGRVVSSFNSDAKGKFLVYLKPGLYTITPGNDAPILFPEAQVKEVEVLAGELTSVTLSFDTGIR
jgi:hypothetical protein